MATIMFHNIKKVVLYLKIPYMLILTANIPDAIMRHDMNNVHIKDVIKCPKLLRTSGKL